ncbi:MAG: tyrosine phosphatase family protein, partial [Rhizomicrobium sp.]
IIVARAIRNRAPHAYPNALLVQYADELLDRRGRMIEAIKSIGAGEIVAEGAIVEFHLVGL